MFFKNLQLYRLPVMWPIGFAALSEQLARGPFVKCASNQPMSRGWIAPSKDGDLVHSIGFSGRVWEYRKMSQQHTPEPWSVFSHSWSNTSVLADGFDHAICGLDINHATEDSQESDEALMGANARRIVACVNALAGVSTEELEQSGFIGGLLEQVECSTITRDNMEGRLNIATVKLAAMKEQRDELLAALETIARSLPQIACERAQMMDFANKVIASAKGGTA